MTEGFTDVASSVKTLVASMFGVDTKSDVSVKGSSLRVKGSWVPYEGPEGGSGWQDTESGDIVYQDDPPGDTVDDASELDIEEQGEMLSSTLGRNRTEEIFDKTSDPDIVEDYANVPLNDEEFVFQPTEDMMEPGQDIVHPDIGRVTIDVVDGNPTIPMGPAAGYIETSSGDTLAMGGTQYNDDVPDDTLDLGDIWHVREADSLDRDAFDPDDLDYGRVNMKSVSNTLRREGEEAPRLVRHERDQLWDGIRDVTRDGGNELHSLTKEAKQSSYSTYGKKREMAFLEAAGADLPARNDTVHAEPPDEELVAAAEKFREASQNAFEEIHGEEAELHRGLGNTGLNQVLEELSTTDGDSIDVETFGMTNYSTEPGVGEKFGRDTVVVSRNVESDEVLAYTDALFGGMQEGEISVEGGVQEIRRDDIKVQVDGDFVPITEVDELPDHVKENVDAGVSQEVVEEFI